MKLDKLFPVIGILLFAYIVIRISPAKIWFSLVNSDFRYILLALLLFVPIPLLQAAKWGYILQKQGIKVKFKNLLRLQLISMFYGEVTPGRLGTLIKIPYLCKETKKPASECSSSVIIDRLFDLVSVALFAALGAMLVLRKFAGFFYFSLAVFFGLLIAMFIFTNKKTSQIMLRIIFRFLVPEKFKEKARISFDRFYGNLPPLTKLIPAFLITLLVWSIIYTQSYLVALAFSVKVPYLYFITTFAIVTVISLVPITLAGLGTREATLLTLLSPYALLPEKIVGFSILLSVISIIIYSLAGLWFIFKIKKKKIARNK
ncbi:flippase-like domain-containing protein [Candidatus Pacearchaeota archaeon]|nr:flippase-like domain-containing protein [Candidatus Pacearchaeota archaeon]